MTRNFSIFSAPKTTVLKSNELIQQPEPPKEEKPLPEKEEVQKMLDELNQKKEELDKQTYELHELRKKYEQDNAELIELRNRTNKDIEAISKREEALKYQQERLETEKKMIEFQDRSLREKEERYQKYFNKYIQEKSGMVLQETLLREQLELTQTQLAETLNSMKKDTDQDDQTKAMRADLENERSKLMEQLAMFQRQKEAFDGEKAVFEMSKHYYGETPTRDANTEAVFIEHERAVLTVQQKRFQEEKELFDEARSKFEKNFSEYLANKEEQIMRQQQLKEEQGDVELLRKALIQSEHEIKQQKIELAKIKESFKQERDQIDEAWMKLRRQVDKLKDTRQQMDLERQNFDKEKHEFELEKEKFAILDQHYTQVENSVDLLSKKLVLKEARLFNDIEEEKNLQGLYQVHDMFRYKEQELKKQLEDAQNELRTVKINSQREILGYKKKFSEISLKNEKLEHDLSEAHHELLKAQTELQESQTASVLLGEKLTNAVKTYNKEKEMRLKLENIIQRQMINDRIREQNKPQEDSKIRKQTEMEIRQKLEEEYHFKFEAALVQARKEITEAKNKRLQQQIDEVKAEYDVRFETMKQKLKEKMNKTK